MHAKLCCDKNIPPDFGNKMRRLWQSSRGWRFALSVLYRFTIAKLLLFHDQQAQGTAHGIWLKRPLVPVKRLTFK